MDKATVQKAVESALSVLKKGDRVELIPNKDGIRVLRVRRDEVKSKRSNLPVWIRTENGLKNGIIEWECSKCGFIPDGSLLRKKCEKCGSFMYLGEPE